MLDASYDRPPATAVELARSRTLRNNASVSTAATATTTSSSSLSHREPQRRRKIPIYVRIVQKDIWLRFHVHLNGTIGSIKDLALQRANAPESDPTQSSYFYHDAINVSAAAKMAHASAASQIFARYRSDLLPKSFVAACPRPSSSLPRLAARSFEISAPAGQAGTSPATSSRSRWKEKPHAPQSNNLHGGHRVHHAGSAASDTSARQDIPVPQPPEPQSSNPASLPNAENPDVDSNRFYDPTSAATADDTPTPESSASQSKAALAEEVSAAAEGHLKADQPQISIEKLGPGLFTDRSPDPSYRDISWGAPVTSMQLPLDPFAGGNAEAKEEEARALARLSGWGRAVAGSTISPAASGRRSIDGAIAGLVPPSHSPLSSAGPRVQGANSDAGRTGAFTDDGSTSDDEPLDPSALQGDSRPVLSCIAATRSSHSLADTVSSGSSADVLTTTETDGLWGTQLEEQLLTSQQKTRSPPSGGGFRPVTSPSDRSRSRTVTAADVGRTPEVGGLALLAAGPVAHQRMSSVPTTTAPLRMTTSQTFTSENSAASAIAVSPASTQSSAARGDGAASPWLDRGRLAGINLDEVSQWREATHGASDRFSIYSFSNGLLLEDWKTVAAYRLRPFELLELQSSSPVERVHLVRDVAGITREAVRGSSRASASLEGAVLDPYYEGWVYVLKPSSTSARQAAKAVIGTWKLRWVTIRGWKMDLFRKKPKAGESSAPPSACYWHLSLIKKITSDKIDSATAHAANPPLPALEQIPACSLTVAFSAASWAAAMPSEFTLPTSGSSITMRCVTQYDHDALLNVLNRAHVRSVARKQGSMDVQQLVDGWRSDAVIRATIAGRGGTVQPGRLAQTKGGRNAFVRARLRPSGWPREFEDADRWSSDSEVEAAPSNDMVWSGDRGAYAGSKAPKQTLSGSPGTPDARRSLDAERLGTTTSAHGLRAAYLQQQQQQQPFHVNILVTKRSSSPLNSGTPPSTSGRRSKLGQAIEAANLSENREIEHATGPLQAGAPSPASEVSPNDGSGPDHIHGDIGEPAPAKGCNDAHRVAAIKAFGCHSSND
ncbi:uncharacterized protein PFL1_02229 [Pseudozyma flocculosa PF-1]|uniref:uncharacterized protein n=1 Tax=Pseudozyma flocculosa PF-1 TaxID=1277687 RepID=UPI0004560F9F|nr:uncharacterized protein PFL1_02229 [Pseudozyma flocculosa PF-1]EPQ30112.1 hypothetical protein PFL1_02229 [Pseudozyma flocculosa PF-1]